MEWDVPKKDPLMYQMLASQAIHMSASEHKKHQSVQHVEVTDQQSGQRLDNFLMARLKGVPRTLVYRLMRKGQVRINGKRCKPSDRLQLGDQVRIPPVRLNASRPVSIPESALSAVKDVFGGQIVSVRGDLWRYEGTRRLVQRYMDA